MCPFSHEATEASERWQLEYFSNATVFTMYWLYSAGNYTKLGLRLPHNYTTEFSEVRHILAAGQVQMKDQVISLNPSLTSPTDVHLLVQHLRHIQAVQRAMC